MSTLGDAITRALIKRKEQMDQPATPDQPPPKPKKTAETDPNASKDPDSY